MQIKTKNITQLVGIATFLVVLGRSLGADAFFGAYIDTIVQNTWRIGICTARFSLTKIITNMYVSRLIERYGVQLLLFNAKLSYIIVGILYFIAGYFQLPRVLFLALTINGIANPFIFTTYQILLRYHPGRNTSRPFSVYRASIQGAYCVGALLVSTTINSIEIFPTFLFISIAAFISILIDIKIPVDHIHSKDLAPYNPQKEFLYDFKKSGIFLIFNGLLSMREYISLLFIPLLGISYNLQLSEIAIIFGISRIPFLRGRFPNQKIDSINPIKIRLCGSIFLLTGFITIGMINDFSAILLGSLCISLGVSLLRSVISGQITNHLTTPHLHHATSFQEFFARGGEVIGSLLFSLLSIFLGISHIFIIFGIGTLVFFIVVLYQKKFKI